MNIPKECKFTDGIDICELKECSYNILGMCTKKGSKNHSATKPFTNFQKIKMMNVDEMVEHLCYFYFMVDRNLIENADIVTDMSISKDKKSQWLRTNVKHWLEQEA